MGSKRKVYRALQSCDSFSGWEFWAISPSYRAPAVVGFNGEALEGNEANVAGIGERQPCRVGCSSSAKLPLEVSPKVCILSKEDLLEARHKTAKMPIL
jgi:hypothetical protein